MGGQGQGLCCVSSMGYDKETLWGRLARDEGVRRLSEGVWVGDE